MFKEVFPSESLSYPIRNIFCYFIKQNKTKHHLASILPLYGFSVEIYP